ncbi:MAG TPA: ABC transporter ATP-binding protein, partial [Anaerolineae bacterium]|nr:ABC transporter ATP-binding protein [Anaerolineae bacterium]
MAEVRLEHVAKRFGDVEAVKDLSLTIEDGRFTVLVGPSGCGKTTTLRLIAGLEQATEGRIFIGARDVTRLEPKDRNVAMVFQNYALYPHMRV